MTLKDYIIKEIEDNKSKYDIDYLKSIESIEEQLQEIKEEYKNTIEEEQEEEQEHKLYVQTLYDELLQHEEKRNISYGEIAYIQDLNENELEKLEEEIITNLQKYEEQ